MDEAFLAQVNADMGVVALLGVVEHQVARPQRRALDRFAHAAEIEGIARQRHAGAFAVDVGDQSAAVKAGLRREATGSVGRAQMCQRLQRNAAGAVQRLNRGRRRRRRFGFGFRRARRIARATAEAGAKEAD